MKERDSEALQKDFESQFNKKETVEFPGIGLKFIDILPTKDIDSVPIFFAPGWAMDKAMFKEVLHSFYRKNRRLLSLEHSTYVKNQTAKSELKNGIPSVGSRKAEEILAVITHSGVTRVDAVFYSDGGINGVLAATESPEKFRNIILVDPGGFILKDRTLKLAGRFIMETFQWVKKVIFIPENRKGLFRIEKEITKYVTENPIRTIKEANAIAKEKVIEMARALHKKGIGMAIIHSADDRVFPMDKMLEIADRDIVDYFYTTEGSHFELLIEPQRYVDLIIHAIDEVEQEKSHRSQNL